MVDSDAVGQIGRTSKGGLKRLALSEADGEVRREFMRWCEEAGCTVQVDGIGNIFATRPGNDPDAKAVLVGSHLTRRSRVAVSTEFSASLPGLRSCAP